MTYARIITPRFYPDTINWLISRGIATTEFAVVPPGVDLIDHDTDYVDEELFDMNPANQVVFSTKDTAATRADKVLFVIDKQTTNIRTDFVAILNHNLQSCVGKFRIASSVANITLVNPAAIACTEVFNADNTANIFTPDNNGDSIVTIDTPQTNEYIAIQFEGASAGNFSNLNDLKIGCILMGEFYTMPFSPDLNVKGGFPAFDGHDIKETWGGKRFSNARWIEGNLATGSTLIAPQTGQPFRTAGSVSYQRLGGRMPYDLSWSFMTDTDLLDSNLAELDESADNFLQDVVNRTAGGHIPLIFTPDSTSATAGDYLFARIMNISKPVKLADRTWKFSMSLEEEF